MRPEREGWPVASSVGNYTGLVLGDKVSEKLEWGWW